MLKIVNFAIVTTLFIVWTSAVVCYVSWIREDTRKLAKEKLKNREKIKRNTLLLWLGAGIEAYAALFWLTNAF